MVNIWIPIGIFATLNIQFPCVLCIWWALDVFSISFGGIWHSIGAGFTVECHPPMEKSNITGWRRWMLVHLEAAASSTLIVVLLIMLVIFSLQDRVDQGRGFLKLLYPFDVTFDPVVIFMLMLTYWQHNIDLIQLLLFVLKMNRNSTKCIFGYEFKSTT